MDHRSAQSKVVTPRQGISANQARAARGAALLTLLLAALGVSAQQAFSAVIFVTTLEQKVGGEEPGCSLQEAIYSANRDESKAIAYTSSSVELIDTACLPGSGADTIVLPTRGQFELRRVVDDALNPFGPTATPIVTSSITIEAHGATLQYTPFGGTFPPRFRAFAVDLGGHLTLRNAYVRGFI